MHVFGGCVIAVARGVNATQSSTAKRIDDATNNNPNNTSTIITNDTIASNNNTDAAAAVVVNASEPARPTAKDRLRMRDDDVLLGVGDVCRSVLGVMHCLLAGIDEAQQSMLNGTRALTSSNALPVNCTLVTKLTSLHRNVVVELESLVDAFAQLHRRTNSTPVSMSLSSSSSSSSSPSTTLATPLLQQHVARVWSQLRLPLTRYLRIIERGAVENDGSLLYALDTMRAIASGTLMERVIYEIVARIGVKQRWDRDAVATRMHAALSNTRSFGCDWLN